MVPRTRAFLSILGILFICIASACDGSPTSVAWLQEADLRRFELNVTEGRSGADFMQVLLSQSLDGCLLVDLREPAQAVTFDGEPGEISGGGITGDDQTSEGLWCEEILLGFPGLPAEDEDLEVVLEDATDRVAVLFADPMRHDARLEPADGRVAPGDELVIEYEPADARVEVAIDDVHLAEVASEPGRVTFRVPLAAELGARPLTTSIDYGVAALGCDRVAECTAIVKTHPVFSLEIVSPAVRR